MKRRSFSSRALTLSEYAKSIHSLRSRRLAHRLLRVFPAELGERSRAPARVPRLLARGGALERPLHDPLEDRGDAEQVVGQIEVPVVDPRTARASAVCRNVLVFARDGERLELEPGGAAE